MWTPHSLAHIGGCLFACLATYVAAVPHTSTYQMHRQIPEPNLTYLLTHTNLPQNGASTGPAPRHAAFGQEPSTLQGSFAPVASPRETHPLLEMVAWL